MKRIAAVCAVLVLALACQAGAVTSYIDTFNGSYVSGPIGVIPAGWDYFGYGPPAYSAQETGLVQPPNDGSNSSWRANVPGSAASGTIAIYQAGVSVDSWALPGQPIDWAYPVYLKADVYGADYGSYTMFKSTLSMQNYTGATEASVEWGDDGIGGPQWTTMTTTIDPGQAAKSGNLVLFLDFNFTGNGFPQVDALIWDSIRIDYTAVPEPSSLVALGTGLLGLMGLIRRRR